MRTGPPDVAARALLGLFIWIVVVVGLITLLRMNPDPQGWPVTLGRGLAIGFDALPGATSCLVDIARAAQVRYLPKWAWALICLIQTPLGGIMYLSIGHIGRLRSTPPGDAKPGSNSTG
jgi:hypothetical protein